MPKPFRIELLDKHDRLEFDCGVDPLNDYLRKYVGQDVRRRFAFCYVAIDNETERVAGYYTLAATGIPVTALPAKTTKKLPRYPTVPAVRIGRLAVDRRYQGKGLGGILIVDSIQRTVQSGIGAFSVIVDAKDDAAVSFYEHFGFQRFEDEKQVLFLPISEALRRLL